MLQHLQQGKRRDADVFRVIWGGARGLVGTKGTQELGDI
jgi:hypothetical protein